MGRTAFVRGAVLGALVVVAGAALAWVAIGWAGRDEPPAPTGTRREVRGQVVSHTGSQLCVVDVAAAGREGPVCAHALGGVAAGMAVGDGMVGELVDVEMDPGSGPTWSLWYSLTASADGS